MDLGGFTTNEVEQGLLRFAGVSVGQLSAAAITVGHIDASLIGCVRLGSILPSEARAIEYTPARSHHRYGIRRYRECFELLADRSLSRERTL